MELSRDSLAVLSGLLTAACVIPYLRDIYRGSTRPQRVSWFVFATLSIVAAVGQFADGALAGAWLASGSALGFTLVLILFAGIRERLETCDVPAPFKGTSIAMISAGLMSLAFMGFWDWSCEGARKITEL